MSELDRAEQLAARVAVLEGALRPFAEYALELGNALIPPTARCGYDPRLLFGGGTLAAAFYDARAALAGEPTQPMVEARIAELEAANRYLREACLGHLDDLTRVKAFADRAEVALRRIKNLPAYPSFDTPVEQLAGNIASAALAGEPAAAQSESVRPLRVWIESDSRDAGASGSTEGDPGRRPASLARDRCLYGWPLWAMWAPKGASMLTPEQALARARDLLRHREYGAGVPEAIADALLSVQTRTAGRCAQIAVIWQGNYARVDAAILCQFGLEPERGGGQ